MIKLEPGYHLLMKHSKIYQSLVQSIYFSQTLRESFGELLFDNLKDSQIEEQYRKIIFVHWREIPFKTEGLSVDNAEKFCFGSLH